MKIISDKFIASESQKIKFTQCNNQKYENEITLASSRSRQFDHLVCGIPWNGPGKG
jgi:hypothetical protein